MATVDISGKRKKPSKGSKMSKPTNHAQKNISTKDATFADNMRPKVAAQYTGLSESTLAKLRMLHRREDGPKFVKLSGCIVYRRADLDEWMERNAV